MNSERVIYKCNELSTIFQHVSQIIVHILQ